MRAPRTCIATARALGLAAGLLAAALATAAPDFHALNYHDVRDDVRGDLDPDQFALSTETLVGHFSWLRAHGYNPVSLDQILAARAGTTPLPERAVVLTFDDGYVSFYTKVYPLLKLFGFPAVFAIVGSWIDAPPGGTVLYGDEPIPRGQFLSWEQIREMQASGLVEIASHSYDLHRGVLANPQGNRQPSAVTPVYDSASGRYETEARYLARVRADLARNSEVIAARTGRRPRIMVWPFGAYNRLVEEVASSLGMPFTFTLSDETDNRLEDLSRVHRILIEANPGPDVLIAALKHPRSPARLRVAHVDLDYLYDADPAQQRRNLDLLLERIKGLRISTVFLQAFADPDGDGAADALYFPNRHLPVRADLFNRVAWQLRTRANVKVFAWMPVLAFVLPDADRQRLLEVRSSPDDDAAPATTAYHRLSPFHPEARQILRDIYRDLGRHAKFDGLLFHDDAFLTDFEDASPTARAFYRERWGIHESLDRVRLNPRVAWRWSRLKTRWLIALTRELEEVVRTYQPQVRTARNLYARVALEPESESWFAQNLDDFLSAYDYTAVMAMPGLEGGPQPRGWIADLAAAVLSRPHAEARALFELQARDWRSETPISMRVLRRQMETLERLGIRHLGYYPDDFLADHPPFDELRETISLEDYPYRR